MKSADGESDLLELVLFFRLPLPSTFLPLFVSSVDSNFQYGTKSYDDGNTRPPPLPDHCSSSRCLGPHQADEEMKGIDLIRSASIHYYPTSPPSLRLHYLRCVCVKELSNESERKRTNERTGKQKEKETWQCGSTVSRLVLRTFEGTWVIYNEFRLKLVRMYVDTARREALIPSSLSLSLSGYGTNVADRRQTKGIRERRPRLAEIWRNAPKKTSPKRT